MGGGGGRRMAIERRRALAPLPVRGMRDDEEPVVWLCSTTGYRMGCLRNRIVGWRNSPAGTKGEIMEGLCYRGK